MAFYGTVASFAGMRSVRLFYGCNETGLIEVMHFLPG